MYKSVTDHNPEYMQEFFQRKTVTYHLRNSNLMQIPHVNSVTVGHHSIQYEGPKIWNSLPNDNDHGDETTYDCLKIV